MADNTSARRQARFRSRQSGQSAAMRQALRVIIQEASRALPSSETVSSLYETDEAAWLAAQAGALRDGRLLDLDVTNLAEYLDDMAARDQRELRSRLIVLLQHILKVVHQKGRLTRSWTDTIDREQDEIKQILRSASMRRHLSDIYAEAWPIAVRRAARETKLPAITFPKANPWTIEQVLEFPVPAD